MNKKHFIPPIIQQWIEKMNDKNSSEFVRNNYAGYLQDTKDAIEKALIFYNIENKNGTKRD